MDEYGGMWRYMDWYMYVYVSYEWVWMNINKNMDEYNVSMTINGWISEWTIELMRNWMEKKWRNK